MSEGAEKKNGAAALLTTLAQSSDKMVQFGILILVGLSGLGNWLATNNNASETRSQVEVTRQQAFRDIRDLHNALDDFEKRQKAVLENQQRIIDTQGRILSEIRK